MANKTMQAAYMTRIKVPGIREPFWFIAQQPYDGCWVATCPVEWLSEWQKRKIRAKDVITGAMLVRFDIQDKGVQVHFDKPVFYEKKFLLANVAVTTNDGTRNIFQMDYGIRWEFAANWKP